MIDEDSRESQTIYELSKNVLDNALKPLALREIENLCYAPNKKIPHWIISRLVREGHPKIIGEEKKDFKSLKIPSIDKKKITIKKSGDFEYETLSTNTIQKSLNPSKGLFDSIEDTLRKYIDTSDLNYHFLTLWLIGTYVHKDFETFPLLTLLARKQSGKTRTLKLLSSLSYGSDGSTSTSVTETFLFRHREGAVFLDECEFLSSREKGNLRELLNSCYKRGNKVVRYREKKTTKGKEYVEENFMPYYPLALANIKGLDDVLSDRSIQLVLQRSNKKQSRLLEDFSTNPLILDLKAKLHELNLDIPQKIISSWNLFVENGSCPEELKDFFNEISKTEIFGRPLEIFFPLFLISRNFGVLDKTIAFCKDYLVIQEGDSQDNPDDMVQTFMDGVEFEGFIGISDLLNQFRASLEFPQDWQNSKWFGRTLKRLGLVCQKRIVNGHIQVRLNPKHSQVEFRDFVDSKGKVDTNTINESLPKKESLKDTKEIESSIYNSTYNTNHIYHTNSTNTTKLRVDIGEIVGISGKREEVRSKTDKMKCSNCHQEYTYDNPKILRSDKTMVCFDCSAKLSLETPSKRSQSRIGRVVEDT